ncbi:hypothetical protein TRFO_26794 [Tritrichomonas foetus]|uniref:non-specific serine/threonine protein kinase n=1 Tax=Tritrichomonas foetus TaxID=1144522 RepID=A0A1J4K6Y0_9EUKA|nr:hypothetical protein TRFO_26794 [Tritrichomonas foetus]|eukprot:OHT05452.1 hypothetical protein TRFO_26794 [Tritrichomonas foetus]
MEFLPGGDLYSLLQNVGSLDEESTRTYVAQIVLALRSLHARGIIHRDIKPDNILITETGKLKLTDFGLSMFGSADRHISEDELGSKTENESSQIIGTPDYLAPEIILSQPHTFTADYFSLGAVIYELLTGVPPFHRDTESETFSAIVIGKVDWSELDECSPEVKSLVAGLLVADPEKRLGANGINEIMNHPWFNGIDWENLDLLDPPFVPQIDDKQSTDYFQQRYQMNQQADADIIEDINNAKSQIGQNTYNDDLKDFTSIDFKSLSKTNCAVAKKMRNDNNFRIEKCDSDLDMKALSAKSFTLRSINPTQVHRISSVSFMPNSLSNVLQGQL